MVGYHVVLLTVYLVPQGVVGAHDDLLAKAAFRLKHLTFCETFDANTLTPKPSIRVNNLDLLRNF